MESTLEPNDFRNFRAVYFVLTPGLLLSFKMASRPTLFLASGRPVLGKTTLILVAKPRGKREKTSMVAKPIPRRGADLRDMGGFDSTAMVASPSKATQKKVAEWDREK
jgi:hypothetical protein